MGYKAVCLMENKDLAPDNLNGVYRDIALLLDCKTAVALHRAFRGQQITFPVELLSRKYITDQIRSEFDGTNLKELASKFGYTEKWLRRILTAKISIGEDLRNDK